MVFDCDYFNTISEGYENTEGWIILLFGLYRCGLGGNHVENTSATAATRRSNLFGVSNDGGSTWTTFDAHGTFIESANRLRECIDYFGRISCVAANNADVQVRFSYLQAPETGDAYNHYYWGIDDVTISENLLPTTCQRFSSPTVMCGTSSSTA